MCTYCAKWFESKTMTPLYEKGKDFICFYCERCTPEVKDNIYKLPFYKLFTWGEKGSVE